MTKSCLLLIDLQNDFLSGGQLAVPLGDEVIAVANELIASSDFVIASQDWHPANHGSFVSQQPGRRVGDIVTLSGRSQVVWPDHCVQGSFGASLAPGLDVRKINHLVTKGEDPSVDSYSAFFDNAKTRSTRLQSVLQERSIESLHIMGLATDYCVLATVRDALDLGYQVTVHANGCRGVEIHAGDCKAAFSEMRQRGAKIV